MSSRTMRVHVALCCMAVACCSPEGNIRGAANLRFLDVEYFNRSDVDKLVAWQMNHTLQNSSRLRHLHADLEPIFRTLAKMPSGGLSHQGARYALFRFFLHERSWLVKGLEPEGAWQKQPERLRKVWESWVPSYLQQHFEQAKRSEGASLQDLVEIAAVIEDLVRQESRKQMAKVFESLELPLNSVISREQADAAVDMYLLVILTAQNLTLAEPAKNKRRLRVLHRTPAHAGALTWLRHLEDRTLKDDGGGYQFAEVSKVAEAFGFEFPSFNNKECSDLKARLVSMEGGSVKPGRIPLTDFYRSSAYRHWRFSESPEYLRDLGVLDESDPHRPHVILANYIASYNNCMRTDGLYAICCRSICGDMMSTIEQQVSGPEASANRVAELITGLAGTRGLDPKLRKRLDGIAAQSGGHVPLHGRLFAQFLHHAFPRDCPYPHEAGTTNPQTPEDWMKSNGRSTTVSREQLEQLARDTCPADVHDGSAPSYCQSEDADLPWSNSEDRQDLLNVPRHGSPPRSLSAEDAAGNLAPSWSMACLTILPAFVVVAYALGVLLGNTTLRRRCPAVVPAIAFIWMSMMCVAFDLLDMRAAVGAGLIFLAWRILVYRFLPNPVASKSADMEV
ncbi:pyrABCN [Symbiodinium natans]|uniref:PyrABCN protein n=1 Tax=Symbiodinium natans TaxID=878477 RepID=A0A812I628_9DINO|nr:pyrABCN [Symbiodinium natans]